MKKMIDLQWAPTSVRSFQKLMKKYEDGQVVLNTPWSSKCGRPRKDACLVCSEGLPSDRAKMLKESGFQLMSTWDEMFKRLEVHQGETGSLEVALEDDQKLHE